MSKVFLGGTWNGSKWREVLIPMLDIDYFNPIVEDWTPECQKEEYRQKELCDIHLYVITPKMTGVFTIAELIDSSNKNPNGTVFMVLSEDEDKKFTEAQLKSLRAVGNMAVNINGAVGFMDSFILLSEYLNENFKKVGLQSTYCYRCVTDICGDHYVIKGNHFCDHCLDLEYSKDEQLEMYKNGEMYKVEM